MLSEQGGRIGHAAKSGKVLDSVQNFFESKKGELKRPEFEPGPL